ncbi:MAG: 2'-5' RNA ligase family protein [Candidatus Hydrogenedentes bacterium]|nr:2'-5' RNA ligase family protein [Candidatus Hydrogenedentota bacterium]
MGFAVELSFDVEADTAVRRLWERLEEHNISDVLPSIGACPHISLAVFDSVDPDRLGPELKQFAAEEKCIETRFGAVGIFPSEDGVVFLAPVVTRELLEMHARFHDRIAALGIQSLEHYQPGNWNPHCTAALDLPHGSVPRAVEACYHGHIFIPVRLQAVQLIEFRPVVTLCSFSLKDASL